MADVLWSPDSRHYAYAARRGGDFVAVFDGREGSADYGTRRLMFSTDSSEVLFVTTSETRQTLVAEGDAGRREWKLPKVKPAPAVRAIFESNRDLGMTYQAF